MPAVFHVHSPPIPILSFVHYEAIVCFLLIVARQGKNLQENPLGKDIKRKKYLQSVLNSIFHHSGRQKETTIFT